MLILLAGVAGCQTSNRLEMKPLGGTAPIGLTADDVVMIMQRAGFSDGEILKSGTELRNALAQFGAVQVRSTDTTEAIMVVRGPYVQVSSQRTGAFVYNVEIGQFE